MAESNRPRRTPSSPSSRHDSRSSPRLPRTASSSTFQEEEFRGAPRAFMRSDSQSGADRMSMSTAPRGVPQAFRRAQPQASSSGTRTVPRGIPIAFLNYRHAPDTESVGTHIPMDVTIPGIKIYADDIKRLIDHMLKKLDKCERVYDWWKVKKILEKCWKDASKIQRIKEKVVPDYCPSFFGTVNMIADSCQETLEKENLTISEMWTACVAVKSLCYSLRVEIEDIVEFHG